MKNKDLFTLHPDENNLLNDGVVEINTSQTDDQGLRVIRHELKTFVCEGEYQAGIYRILSTYLKHFDQPRQPAVWVSGFFGSGKSHLVKIISYLWENFTFPNGDSARTLKPLPQDITDLFQELELKQKIHGRLAVRGTLKDFPSADIRYSFLQLFFNAMGLPPLYHHFKFVYWAIQEGIYDDLKTLVEASGKDFRKEYENLFVSSAIARAVLQLKPEFADSEAQVKENFKANFKRVDAISRDQFLSAIRDEALPLRFGDKIPSTIIVLDEVQQFIGQDGNKTIDLQNLAQDVSSNFDGKFLLIGTGQSALAETPQLQPLIDRFSVKVSLSDTDVETVTRKTVLEKKPTVIGDLNDKLENALGEISRNLAGTEFGYRAADRTTLVADYPILPSTRKFWKKVLQIIDTAGTAGQLRSQLRIVDESIKAVADQEMGHIVPADFIFEQKQQQLLQNALLLNETNNLILERKAKGGDGLLEGRILSIIFLLSQLPDDLQGGRLKSDEATIADLLIADLNETSDAFRNQVKGLIHKLADEDQVLMRVNDEFKLQTKAGSEWEQEYIAQAVKLNNSGEDLIQALRREKLLSFFREKTRSINILQGQSRQKRDFDIWDKAERPNTDNKLHLWLRDGWNESETLVLNEIRAEGADAPLAYAFVGKARDQELRSEIVKYLAARFTLDKKGLPSSPEAQQARKAMETRMKLADLAIDDLRDRIGAEADIYLAGGNHVQAGSIRDNIEDALRSLADRQFPEFKSKADYKDWDKALARALAGEPDALVRIGWKMDVHDHPVAIDILRFMGNQTKTGKDIRNQFMKAPYGWSQDAIDAIIAALWRSEHISTAESSLTQSKIGAASFKKEMHTLSASGKIKVRKIYQEAVISCQPGQEFSASNAYLDMLKSLATRVSGDAPFPEPINVQFLKDIENLDGNERLLSILDQQEDLKAHLKDWHHREQLAMQRLPAWKLLSELMEHAPVEGKVDDIQSECEAIRQDRLLFHEPDLIQPRLDDLTALLKERLNQLKEQYLQIYSQKMEWLQANEYFSRLTPEQKHPILARHQLLKKPDLQPLDARGLLNELNHTSLPGWQTRIAALSGQFQACVDEAVAILAPQAKTLLLPRMTITSQSELDAYLQSLKTRMEEALRDASAVILK